MAEQRYRTPVALQFWPRCKLYGSCPFFRFLISSFMTVISFLKQLSCIFFVLESFHFHKHFSSRGTRNLLLPFLLCFLFFVCLFVCLFVCVCLSVFLFLSLFSLFSVRGSYSSRVPRSSLARVRRVLVPHIMEEEAEDPENEQDDRREDRQQEVEGRIAESQNNHIMSA